MVAYSPVLGVFFTRRLAVRVPGFVVSSQHTVVYCLFSFSHKDSGAVTCRLPTQTALEKMVLLDHCPVPELCVVLLCVGRTRIRAPGRQQMVLPGCIEYLSPAGLLREKGESGQAA